MSDEYTPTTNEVRADYVRDHTRNFDSYLVGRSLTSEQEVYGHRFDRWLAARDAKVAQKARAEGWDAARAEVRLIPCWYNPETGQGGFDLQHGDVASEEGAWMEVTRVLSKNPYQEQEEQS